MRTTWRGMTTARATSTRARAHTTSSLVPARSGAGPCSMPPAPCNGVNLPACSVPWTCRPAWDVLVFFRPSSRGCFCAVAHQQIHRVVSARPLQWPFLCSCYSPSHVASNPKNSIKFWMGGSKGSGARLNTRSFSSPIEVSVLAGPFSVSARQRLGAAAFRGNAISDGVKHTVSVFVGVLPRSRYFARRNKTSNNRHIPDCAGYQKMPFDILSGFSSVRVNGDGMVAVLHAHNGTELYRTSTIPPRKPRAP